TASLTAGRPLSPPGSAAAWAGAAENASAAAPAEKAESSRVRRPTWITRSPSPTLRCRRRPSGPAFRLYSRPGTPSIRFGTPARCQAPTPPSRRPSPLRREGEWKGHESARGHERGAAHGGTDHHHRRGREPDGTAARGSAV